MTAQQRAETGYTRDPSRKRETRPPGVILPILRAWECIRVGAGRGQQIAEYSTTARRATSTASHGMHRDGRFGGMKLSKNGWGTTFLISSRIPNPRITWVRSL